VVRRLGRRSLEVALNVELGALTNVRLRVTYTDPARESGDLYGKVTGQIERDGGRLTRIHLTSVDAMDQAMLAQLREGMAAPDAAGAVSKGPEARS
jgi:DNA polymerase III delta prime subunit